MTKGKYIKSKEHRRKISEFQKNRKRTPHSIETKIKMSIIKKGKKFTDEHKNALSVAHKNKLHTEEQKRKVSETMLSQYKNGRINVNKGKKYSEEERKKLSEIMKGKNKGKKLGHPWNYIDGRSLNPRNYYDDWNDVRQIIYKRDKFVCQICNQHKPLDVHHIVPFLDSFDNSLSNLISLCRSCHTKVESKLLKERKRRIVI